MPEWAHQWAMDTGKEVYVSPMNIYNKEPQKAKEMRASNEEITIEKNEAGGGAGVVAWLLGKGVKTLIMQKMSQPPYQMIKEEGSITIFYVGSDRIELPEALKRYEDKELIILDDTNAKDIVKSHDRQHQKL